MSNSNPIIPPGSPLQRTMPAKNSSFFVAVFAVLALHVLFLAGLLIQGCKREDSSSGLNAPAQQQPLLGTTASNLLATEQTQPPPAPNRTVLPTVTPPAGVAESNAPAAPANLLPGDVANKTIAARPSSRAEQRALTDTTSTSAISGVGTDSGLATAPAASKLAPETTNLAKTYTVKPGDTLTRIARAHGTTVQALRAANGLKTDRLLVGHKLNLPEKQ